MDFPTLTITHERTSKGRVVKSRQFQATLLTYLTADRLWALGQAGQALRPVWITYAAPHEMGRAFTANLRGGRKAKIGHDVVLELPRSAPHRWLSQRCDGGATVTTAYLGELFELDPGESSERIAFVFMPPRCWLDRQAEALEPEFRGDALDVTRAALFAAFLDRRSPLPLVHDLRFQLQLYRAALEAPWTQGPRTLRHGEGDLWASCPSACGLDAPRLVDVSHSEFEVLILNPNTVRTGLNNLIAFTTAIWHEIDYSSTTYLQANGRFHRIGQTRPVTILYPYWAGTAQQAASELIAREVTAAHQVSGFDICSALEAAGAGEDSASSLETALALGEALYRQLAPAA